MNQKELNELIEAIDKSGIADPLIEKLSKEFDLSNNDVKETLKSIFQLLNIFSNKS